jgi:hypothetical protein
MLVLIGLLVSAGAAKGATSGEASAIETHSNTRAGEGSIGLRRVFRNGCYQSESRGSPGGGADVHDSEAGCADAAVFQGLFRQIDALIADGSLVPEPRPSEAAAKGGRRRGGLGDGAVEGVRSIVIDGAGRRLAPKDEDAVQRLGLVARLEPTIDAWYVTPPRSPRGGGPQLIALSSQKSGARSFRMLQASLVATGAWWCHLTVPAEPSAGVESFTGPAPRPLASAQATAILGRVLAGVTARALATGDEKGEPSSDDALSVEAAVGTGPRTAIRSKAIASGAQTRFVAEMRAQSAACASPSK